MVGQGRRGICPHADYQTKRIGRSPALVLERLNHRMDAIFTCVHWERRLVIWEVP